jgi:branched-chain amino acid transport system substrate-binding protein
MKQHFALFLVLLALGLAMPAATLAADAEPIKIGAVFSITGGASFLGEPEKNSVNLLADMINERGGVLGRKIEMVVYDDETDVNKCVMAVDKLLRKDQVVAVIGPTTSGNTLAVMPKFEPAKIPLISCASADKIVIPVTPWIFKDTPSDRFAVLKILEYAKVAGQKKIAIITVSDGFGQAGREFLKELIPAQGFNLVADEVYGPKDTDMTAQLTSIKNLNPDAVICWGTNPGPAVIARNRVQLGMQTQLYMSHGVASKKFIELAGEAAEGLMLPAGRLIVASQVPDGQPQKKLLMDYKSLYETKFKSEVSTFGGHGWDGLNLIVKAIEIAKSAEPQAIRDALEKIQNFVGTAGIYNLSPNDHNGLDQTAFEMVKIEKGDWKIVK